MKTFRTFGRKRDSPSQSNNHSQDQYYDQQQDQYLNQPQPDKYLNQQDQYYQGELNTQQYYDQTNDYNQNYRQVEYVTDNNSNQLNNDEYEPSYNQNLNDNIIQNEEQIDYDVLQTNNLVEDETSEKHVKINNVNEYDTDEDAVKHEPIVEKRPKYDFHFATKIRNSGYWGKVYLRKGTWMVIIGFVLFIISIVLIGVFWGFWYSNALNYPMRILAITFLSSGLSMIAFGLINNYFMYLDRKNKNILGSPLRASTYVLAVCLFLLVVASDCITVYYTYWKNRWVNTPLIIIAIVLYFFAGLGFLGALWTIIEFNLVRYGVIDSEEERKIKKEKRKDFEERLKRLSSETLGSRMNTKKSWDLLYAEQQGLIKIDETDPNQSNEKNGFRKNHPIKLVPKPVILTSPVTSPNTTQLDDSQIKN